MEEKNNSLRSPEQEGNSPREIPERASAGRETGTEAEQGKWPRQIESREERKASETETAAAGNLSGQEARPDPGKNRFFHKAGRTAASLFYGLTFVVCVLSFLAALTSFLIAVLYDYYSWDGSAPRHFRPELEQALVATALFGILTLASFIYLCVKARKPELSGGKKLGFFDRVYTEIQAVAFIALFFLGGETFFVFATEALHRILFSGQGSRMVPGPFGLMTGYGSGMEWFPELASLNLCLMIAAFCGLVSAGLGLMLILSWVRKRKARRLIWQSVTGKLAGFIIDRSRDIYHGGSAAVKVILLLIGVCVASLLAGRIVPVLTVPLLLAAIIVLVPLWAKKYEQVRQGMREVKNGNLSYKIPVQPQDRGELAELARDVNEISRATELAVQNELKNQKLKTDLISNVSHDLKTPLTSIITYIDLLKTEGLGSPGAEQYLDVLDQKARRLKKLTDDLFEAAKASSGDLPVRMEKVEMLSIIHQARGEMSSLLEQTGLEVIVASEKEKHYVWADGQLLWRAFENLLGNVAKYALPGSRVYIDVAEKQYEGIRSPEVILEVKNISRDQLNISAEELMERFKRGDESRNTEGSGLGLAITRDLIRLQDGWFGIKVDGDLFKSMIVLKRHPDGGGPA